MPSQADFNSVFTQLKSIMEAYAANLQVKVDQPDNYYLDGPYSSKYKKEVFFGAVQIKKNYVSYHLMPVYMCPELVQDISPTLKKRMQGKSCFNFTKLDPATLDELRALTEKGYQAFIAAL
jgi:hypothetical protein